MEAGDGQQVHEPGLGEARPAARDRSHRGGPAPARRPAVRGRRRALGWRRRRPCGAALDSVGEPCRGLAAGNDQHATGPAGRYLGRGTQRAARSGRDARRLRVAARPAGPSPPRCTAHRIGGPGARRPSIGRLLQAHRQPDARPRAGVRRSSPAPSSAASSSCARPAVHRRRRTGSSGRERRGSAHATPPEHQERAERRPETQKAGRETGPEA